MIYVDIHELVAGKVKGVKIEDVVFEGGLFHVTVSSS
jgi:hypothetical protein